MTQPFSLPLLPTERDRVEQAALRHRLLTGQWGRDALEREGDFFAAELRQYLPPAELSRNPFLSVHSQLCVLYDCDPELEEGVQVGEHERLIHPLFTSTAAERLLYQSAANECFIRLDVQDGKAEYRVVPCDLVIEASADPAGSNPSQPVRVVEARWREKYGWTREIWDVTDPGDPIFRVESLTESGDYVDITEEVTGGFGWPDQFRDLLTNPVLPYVLYHRKLGSTLFDVFTGYELALGTLSVSAAWTMWLAGLRDGSYPQRVLMDGDVLSGTTGSIAGGSVVVASPLSVLRIVGQKRGEEFTSPSIGQWDPAMDPDKLASAIAAFESGLAQFAGLSPADLSRGEGPQSGYAIVVSRSGKKKASEKLKVPCLLGDQLLLSRAAKLVNRAVGSVVCSEVASEYKLEYPALEELDTTHEEREKMEQQEKAAKIAALQSKTAIVITLKDAGFLTPQQALLLLAPELSCVFGEAATALATGPEVSIGLRELQEALEKGDLVAAKQLIKALAPVFTIPNPQPGV